MTIANFIYKVRKIGLSETYAKVLRNKFSEKVDLKSVEMMDVLWAPNGAVRFDYIITGDATHRFLDFHVNSKNKATFVEKFVAIVSRDDKLDVAPYLFDTENEAKEYQDTLYVKKIIISTME